MAFRRSLGTSGSHSLPPPLDLAPAFTFPRRGRSNEEEEDDEEGVRQVSDGKEDDGHARLFDDEDSSAQDGPALLMPFKSKAQQGFMFANMPKTAKKWAKETPNMKSLPKMVAKKSKRKG
jgi:hypothetical protein